MSGFNFYHSGDLGDIIYSLPTIKELGGGVLHLGNKHWVGQSPDKQITQDVVDQLYNILIHQPYLTDIKFTDDYKIPIHYNLNMFRKFFVEWCTGKLSVNVINEMKKLNIVELTAREFLDNTSTLYLQKWLTCNNPKAYINYPIIINRTPRYNNDQFPWKQLIKDFGKKMIFIGHEEEHEQFKIQYGDVKYYETTELNNAYELVAGTKIFIGNQSLLYSFAEGLKRPCIQETCANIQTSSYFRKDAYITNTTTKFNYIEIKNFIIKYII